MGKNLLKQPAVRPVQPVNIPDAECISLRNKIPVYLIEAGTEDIVRLDFTFGAGCTNEYMPLLASVVNSMLAEGTANFTAGKLNRELDFHGAFYHLYADRDRAGIVIYCMNKYLDKILELAREILFYPVFPVKEFSTHMKKRYRSFLISREKVNNLVTDQFFESIFGEHHPYGRQIVNDDFKKLSIPVLKDFHSAYYIPDDMAIIISGKIHKNIAGQLDYYFGDIRSYETYTEESYSFLENKKDLHIHIEKPGSVQTAIKIGSRTINKRHPDYPGLKILNVILGGYFGSRLMKNIREEKGYTYGISSSVSSFILSGFKVISTEVSKIFTQKAIDEIYREISLLQRAPVEKEELAIVRNYMLGDMVRMFDGPFALADSFRSVWEFGLDNSYYYKLAERIKSIEPDEITSLAQTYYNINELYEITAGSK
jgi:zinc protease